MRDPVRQARAWVAIAEPERAVHVLEAAGTRSPTAMVAAWQAERDGRWDEAASLWRSLGRARDEARCLARAAPKAPPVPSQDALPAGDEPRADET